MCAACNTGKKVVSELYHFGVIMKKDQIVEGIQDKVLSQKL